jgi:hypothetical protein
VALLEPWRTRYLDALGIEQWIARAPLPNAAPSIVPLWSEVPEAEPEPAPAAVAPVEAEVRAPVAGRAPSRLPEVDVQRRAPAPAEMEAAADAAPQSRRNTVHFSLLMVRLSGDLMVVDAPQGTHPINDYLRLAAQVGRALGADPAALTHDIFNWPIAHHPRLATDHAAASEALTGCLSQQLQGERRRLLVLGEAAQRWISRDVLAGVEDCQAAQGPSLWRCLSAGEAKRTLWETLVRAGFTALH